MTMNTTIEPPFKTGGDLVLQEIWRIKDQLSAARSHDVHKLFAEARKREGLSASLKKVMEEDDLTPPAA